MRASDIIEDKSLWERHEFEGVGKVLIIEESYYDAIAEAFKLAQAKIDLLETQIKQHKEA